MKLPVVAISLWAAVCFAQAPVRAPAAADAPRPGSGGVAAAAPTDGAPAAAATQAAALLPAAGATSAAIPGAPATVAPAGAGPSADGPSAPGAALPVPPGPGVVVAPGAAPDALRASPPTLTDASPSELSKLENDDELSMGWTLLRTFVVLGVVVMSIYISLNWGMRKLMGIKGPIGATSLVSVLERVPLDQKRSLFVVKAGSEYLLLGGAEGSLSLLSKLDSAEVDKLRAERPAPTLTFSPLLQKLLTRRGPRT